jgi:alpha-tubulin suppressor-like RCC1 family protein
MASNKVLKVFTANGTFTAPAGVTRVRAVATQANNPFFYSRGKLGVLALTQAGLLYGWGLNSQGEAGIGNQTPTSVPTLVVGPQAFQSIFGSFGGSSGSTSMFGLTKDGILLAWGATNTGGQLGVGDVTPRSSPTLVLGNGVPWAQVQSDNSSFTYGLTQAGVLYAWGFNTNGQLGDGTVAAKSSPVAVLGGLTFKQFVLPSISNSDACIVALTTAGAAYAWGLNSNGQLGVGDVTPRSSPVAVLGGLTFSQVVGAQVSFFGITSAGAAYAWGLNQNGQLGVGDVTPRSSPVAVLGGLAFSKILGNGGLRLRSGSEQHSSAYDGGSRLRLGS